MEVGHSRNAIIKVWSCDVWQTLNKDSSDKSTWQNRNRSLSKEVVSCLETLTVSSEMLRFGDFGFWAIVISWCKHIALFQSEFICLNSLKFIPTWLRVEAKLCVVQIISSFIFYCSCSLQCLASPIFPDILQTSMNTLNLMHPSSIACLESSTFFWHTKHSFRQKAFFRFFGTSKHGLKIIKSIYFVIKQVTVGMLFADYWCYAKPLSFIWDDHSYSFDDVHVVLKHIW